MINHDTANSAYFSIDSANALIVPTNPRGLGWNRYYLDGSAIGLYDCATNLQTRYLLKRSISFVFESCAWRGAIEGGETYNQTALEFLTHAASFLSSSTSTNAQQGASQFAMLVAMYGFMQTYTLWASECPHFDHHNAGVTQIPEYSLLDYIGGGGQSSLLNGYGGANGLLK